MAVAGQGALAQLDADRASALSELELQRAGAMSEYRSAVAEAIAASELERAQALYDEAVRVEASYRTYSEELLAAWGLTLSGAPLAAESTAAGGTGTGGVPPGCRRPWRTSPPRPRTTPRCSGSS